MCMCNSCLLGILFMSHFSQSLLVRLKAISFPVPVFVYLLHMAVSVISIWYCKVVNVISAKHLKFWARNLTDTMLSENLFMMRNVLEQELHQGSSDWMIPFIVILVKIPFFHSQNKATLTGGWHQDVKNIVLSGYLAIFLGCPQNHRFV